MHPHRRPIAAVAVAAALLVGAAACSHDGRSLAPTRPDQTTTTRAPATLGTAAPSVFTLSSPDVLAGGVLPATFTCSGEGLTPKLDWLAPPAAEEYALVVRDRDADGFVHWILTGIDPTVTGFGSTGIPESATEQVNSEGALGWLPPCPPQGSGRHVYDFVLHALTAPLTIDPAAPAAEVAATIEHASVAQATMSVSVSPDTSGTANP